jgi:hypothetical protein
VPTYIHTHASTKRALCRDQLNFVLDVAKQCVLCRLRRRGAANPRAAVSGGAVDGYFVLEVLVCLDVEAAEALAEVNVGGKLEVGY